LCETLPVYKIPIKNETQQIKIYKMNCDCTDEKSVKNRWKKNQTILKTIKLILNQKRYIGADKLNMCQLRTISSKKKTYILKKNNIGAN